MRKTFFSLLAGCALFAGLLLASCGGKQDSPTELTKTALELMKKGDAKGYVDLIDIQGETDPQTIESDKTILTGLIMMGLDKIRDEHQGIKDYEVLEEEALNDSVTKVKFKINFNDGTDKKDSGKCIKRDGKWYLKF